MAKQPKQSPHDMTNEELRDRFRAIQGRIRGMNRKIPWIAGGIALAGLALAGGLAILGIAGVTAAIGIGASSIAAAGSSMSVCGMIRDTQWETEAMYLKIENDSRLKVAEAQKKRAAAEEARKLREEFDAALSAMSEGRGLDKSVSVRGPLRLKAKSLFGSFAA